MTSLHTERLTLRLGTPADVAELTAAIAHWDVARMLERLPWPYTLEHAKGWLAQPKPHHRPEPLITLRETGAIVGGTGLVEKGKIELGYWLKPSAWGQGYATEAARAMVGFARDTLERFVITPGRSRRGGGN